MKFKKILSIFLSLVLVLSVFAGLEINAYAATSGTSGGVNWNLDKSTGVFTITKNGNGRGADYSKYQFFGGNNQPWYNDRKSIKTVNVEEGVIQVGSYWFYDCTNLTTVNFNSSTLDTLGDDLFRGCTSLQSINLKMRLTIIVNFSLTVLRLSMFRSRQPIIPITIRAKSPTVHLRAVLR